MRFLPAFEIACFLLGSVALSTAARSNASGLRPPSILALAHAVLAAVSIFVLHGTSVHREGPLGVGVAWALATATAVVASAYCSRRERRAPNEIERLLARRARHAFAFLAALEALVLGAAFTRSSDAGFLILFAYLLAPIPFAVGALRLLRVHRQRGDVARAELARFLWLVYLSIPFSLAFTVLQALGHAHSTAFGLVGALGVVVFVNPVATPLLVGVRAPAFDVVTPAYPPERAARGVLRGLLPVAVLAAILLVVSVALHLSRCDGRLVELPEPKTPWRTLPIAAEGDARSLGPFKLRGYTASYKTYPSGTAGASLVDPRLCFASAVSLSAWFDDGMESMYRSLGELRLRHDSDTDVWVVSGTRRAVRPDEFVAAFRRELDRRFAFDYDASAFYPAVGGLSLLVGLVALAFFRRKAESARAAGKIASFRAAALAYGCVLVALTAPLMLEWALVGHPRPGAELAVEVVSP